MAKKKSNDILRPNMFELLNYQHILREFLNYSKELNFAHSYEFIANRIDIEKSDLSNMVNQDSTVLNSSVAFKLGKFLKFSPEEQQYFENSIAYTRAKGYEEKLTRFHTLRASVPHALRNVAHKEMEYFSQWYIPVIREVIEHPSFDGDLVKWTRKFVPPIKKPQLEKGIQLLLDLGYIIEVEKGVYSQADHRIHSNKLSQPAPIRLYQNQMFELGMNSQDLAKEERNLSSSSFKTTMKGKRALDAYLKEVQQGLIKIVEEHTENANYVYCLNWQLFPLTKRL